MGLPHGFISISQINKYLTCPKQYELKYIFKIEEPKGSPLVVGSSSHKLIEEASKRKMQDGELISEEEMKAIYDDYWNKKADEIDWKEDEDPEAEKERGFSMAKDYIESDIGKGLNPIGTEVKFTVPVLGIDFLGYIDIIDDVGEGSFVRDLKTTKKTPSKDVADLSLQLAGYSYAYRTLSGEREAGASLDYMISLKRGNKISRYETEITDERIDRFQDTLWNVAHGIDKEVFPRNEGPNCSWCGVRAHCKGE